MQPWMFDQVVEMISKQYNRPLGREREIMEKFYDHPFQKEQAIKIVGLDGKKVIGFQSFFYWPYYLNGHPLRAYQSGKSIVHENYRGSGLFLQLLNHIDIVRRKKKVDFLIGFPIDISINSLLRNHWINILNLSWYVKIINPLSIIGRFDTKKITFQSRYELAHHFLYPKGLALSTDPNFRSWRKVYSGEKNYYQFNCEQSGSKFQFDLKANLRGKMKELIVGDVLTDCSDPELITHALRELVKASKKQRVFTLLSIALNENYFNSKMINAVKKAGFTKIDRKIYFCVKDFEIGSLIYNPKLWRLYRSDIDTW